MVTLNRFPLLGLWAEEAARRLGYRKDDAEALGHAYAIRARPHTPRPAEKAATKTARAPRRAPVRIRFGGDDLDVGYDVDSRLRGRVGGGRPQTAASYRSAVRAKFPPGYYEALQKAFRDLLKTIPPRALRGRCVYDLYDEWKKSCGVGRLVDLDRLLDWRRRRAGAAPARSA